MKKGTLIIALFLTTISWAQPITSGGGLKITKVTDKYGTKINLKNQILKIRTFDLVRDTVYWETFLYEQSKLPNLSFKIAPSNAHIEERKNRSIIFAIYKKDTMLIDIDVKPRKVMGITDTITLKIRHGSFKFKDTLERLNSKVNTDFLKDKNVHFKYYLSRFYKNYHNNDLNLAEASLNKAVKKNNNNINCEMLNAFSLLNTKMKKYNKSILYLSKVLNKKCIPEGKFDQYDYYKKRIDLYTKNKEYHKALKDYDTIAIKHPYYWAKIARAYYKFNYLKNYDAIIKEVTNIIKQQINNTKLSERNSRETAKGLAEGLFVIGACEYYKGNKEKAYNHWFNFLTLNFRANYINDVQGLFNKLIEQNPSEAKLYFFRALCYDNYWYDSVIKAALKDLNQAAQLGYNFYEINYYRSYFNFLLEKEEKALKEIKKALKKEPNNLKYLILNSDIQKEWGGMHKDKLRLSTINIQKTWFE